VCHLLLLVLILGTIGCGWWRGRCARHDVQEIDLALELYWMTHANYPSGTKAELCRILLGENLNGQNPREIPYLEAKPKEINRDGLFVDPWGTPYHIEIRGKPVVYSYGPDGVDGKGAGDDVRPKRRETVGG
jgi:hypothetical protein